MKWPWTKTKADETVRKIPLGSADYEFRVDFKAGGFTTTKRTFREPQDWRHYLHSLGPWKPYNDAEAAAYKMGNEGIFLVGVYYPGHSIAKIVYRPARKT